MMVSCEPATELATTTVYGGRPPARVIVTSADSPGQIVSVPLILANKGFWILTRAVSSDWPVQ